MILHVDSELFGIMGSASSWMHVLTAQLPSFTSIILESAAQSTPVLNTTRKQNHNQAWTSRMACEAAGIAQYSGP